MAKYLDLLNEGKEEKAKKGNTTAAAGAKSNLEQFISKKKAQAVTLSSAREAAISSPSFDVTKIIALDAEIVANNSELSTAESLLTELF